MWCHFVRDDLRARRAGADPRAGGPSGPPGDGPGTTPGGPAARSEDAGTRDATSEDAGTREDTVRLLGTTPQA
jgi:hypothetical protein